MYVLNPVLIPWQLNLTTADCLAGGVFNISQLSTLPVNQFYLIPGPPTIYYNFNSVDFDAINLQINYRTSAAYYYRAQITAFTGMSTGTVMVANNQNGVMVEMIFQNDNIVCEITAPATVGDGSLQINGLAYIVTLN